MQRPPYSLMKHEQFHQKKLDFNRSEFDRVFEHRILKTLLRILDVAYYFCGEKCETLQLYNLDN